MTRTQDLRVVDRSAQRQLHADVIWGTAFEALLALFVLNGGPPFDRYESGERLARAARGRLPATVTRAVRGLKTRGGQPWSALIGVVAAGHPPFDVATVRARLANLDPVELKADLIDAARASGRDKDVASLVSKRPRELASDLVDALEDLPAELYSSADSERLLERNSAEAEKLLSEADGIGPVIERLTHGLVYTPAPGINRVVLIPSLVHRPWTLVLDHEHSRIFCYPARADAELSAPDGTLIGIYRALGDGTRLRILRRLAAGAATVGRIGEELGLAKSTVHEHLLSLRTAGLVRMPVAGGFELEPELPDLNWMLKEFLGLEMRRECEGCQTPLEPDGPAFICSYECTFCASCAGAHKHVCPNCGGELVKRPRRAATRPARPRGVRPHRREREANRLAPSSQRVSARAKPSPLP